jgi:hypothetical protein
MLKIRLLTALMAMLVIAGLVPAIFAQDIPEAVFVSEDDLAITVYNNMALVRDTRTFELSEGLNIVSFAGISPEMDRTSVIFSASDASYAVQHHYVSARSYDTRSLLYQNIGQTIRVTRRDGDTLEGTLLNADSDIILQLAEDEVIALSPDQIIDYRFAVFPTDLEPALQVTVNSASAGERQVTLTYLTTGINWTATDYNLELAADNETVDITGWATISNNTAAAFENAQITLASSDLNRVQFVTTQSELAAMPTATAMAAYEEPATGGFAPVEQPPGITFNINQRVTLPAYNTRYVQFIAGANANARNIYLYDASPRIFGYSGFNTSPTYGTTGITAIQNFLEFSTAEDGGLGTALPAGRLRTFRQNQNGSTLLIGETQIAYTPEDQTVRVFLENTAGITGERRQTEFQILSETAVQESYEIRLSNRTDEPLTVIVPERMTRSQTWEVLSSSIPYEQPDPFQIVFEVEVPAGEDVVITYTVLYTRM